MRMALRHEFFFQQYGDNRDLHSFPTRRSSDLDLGGEDRRARGAHAAPRASRAIRDRKSTRLNSSHTVISYAVFCLKKKKAAVVPRPDELKGQGVVAFVTLKTGVNATRDLKEEM